MFARHLLLCLAVLLSAGCHTPFEVFTRVKMDPILVRTELPPQRNPKPLVEQVLSGRRDCRAGKIALVDVDGLLLNRNQAGLLNLGDNAVDLFREKLEHIASGKNYRGVVLRINSPGGGVTGTDIMWKDLTQFRMRTGLPVVVICMDVTTGGAYYLATASDHIIAHPTTITGGLGVILNLYNLEDTMSQFNIFANIIKEGERVDIGSTVRVLEEDEKDLLQQIANEFHTRLIQIVTTARPDVAKNEEVVFDGRIFTASQAMEMNLIDQVGYVEDAVAVAQQLGGCHDASLVYLSRCGDPARTLYSISPDAPVPSSLLPGSIPGIMRDRLPTFLYIWQADPTLAVK